MQKEDISKCYTRSGTFTFVGVQWIQPEDLSGFNPRTILPESAQQRGTRKPKLIFEMDAKRMKYLRSGTIFICRRARVDPALGLEWTQP